MAIVTPFRALTYNFETFDDLSALVAPPYDVISEEEQAAYYDRHEYNVIRLILGKKKTGDSDWDNRYTRSADTFKRWQVNDILMRSESPAFYITSLSYDPGDGRGTRIRWGMIGLVRIEEQDSCVILPHERTFSAHKEDRLKLMRACQAQFSQIFGLYEDPDNEVFLGFEHIKDSPPLVSLSLEDKTSHKMWPVYDKAFIKGISDAMFKKKIFIADGHHRYETARNFRNTMRARYGWRPPNRSYEYVMMYLTNMDDEGLTILPSHRLIKRCHGFVLDRFLETVKRWFQVQSLPVSRSGPSISHESLKDQLEEKGRETSAIAFYFKGAENVYLMSLKPDVRSEMGEDLDPVLQELDVLVLSRFILQKSLGFTLEDLDDEEIFHYQSDMAKAIASVDAGTYQMAFLLNPTKMHQFRAVTRNSLIMPRKSTYFYPKVLTGLVFNTIDPYELIQIP